MKPKHVLTHALEMFVSANLLENTGFPDDLQEARVLYLAASGLFTSAGDTSRAKACADLAGRIYAPSAVAADAADKDLAKILELVGI